jgi:putative ABC transport system permease protein
MLTLRSLIRSPWYTCLAVATMAPGLGGVLALSAILDVPFFRDLPFPASDRLVAIQPVRSDTGVVAGRIPGPLYEAVLRHRGLEFVSFAEPATLYAVFDQGTDVWEGVDVSQHALSLLGVRPSLGRLLAPADFEPGSDTPLLISASVWESRFGRDPNVLGKVVQCEGRTARVIGVYAAGTLVPAFPRPLLPDFVMPSRRSDEQIIRDGVMTPLARIRAGTTFRDVQSEMSTQLGSMIDRYPQLASKVAVKISFVRDYMYGAQRRLYLLLACAAVLITAALCFNTSNLLLARLRHKQGQVAVQRALGATRKRLLADLCMENALLALAALPLAVTVASLICAYVRQVAPRAISAHIAPTVDVRIWFLGIALSLFVALCVSAVTAPRMLRAADEQGVLRGIRGNDRGRRLWSGALVTVQVCVVLAVLVGASLMTSSVTRLMHLPVGAEVDNVLVFDPRIPYARYSGIQAKEFWENLVTSVEEHPDVVGAAAAFALPMTRKYPWASMIGRGEDWESLGGMYPISRQYFETLNIPIKSGRTFTREEDRANAPVGVVNEAAVRLLWPDDGKAIGRTIRSPWFPHAFTVVGVAADTRNTPDMAVMPSMYVPVWTYKALRLRLVVRMRKDSPMLRASIEAAARRLERDVVVPPGETYASVIAQWWQRPQFLAILLAIFAIVALGVVAIGTAAVVGYTVHLRSRELGVRLALGATRGAISRLVLKDTCIATGLGIVAGSFAGAFIGRLLQSELYSTEPSDFLSHGVAIGVLFALVIGAAYVPAWIAGRTDPSVTLRDDS